MAFLEADGLVRLGEEVEEGSGPGSGAAGEPVPAVVEGHGGGEILLVLGKEHGPLGEGGEQHRAHPVMVGEQANVACAVRAERDELAQVVAQPDQLSQMEGEA